MTAAAEQPDTKKPPPKALRLVGARPVKQLRPGIRFGETMRGQIALRCADPAEGYTDAAAFGAELHASVNIDNLDSFIADPLHRGSWRAVLNIPVLGGEVV